MGGSEPRSHWCREVDSYGRLNVGKLYARNSFMNDFLNHGDLIKKLKIQKINVKLKAAHDLKLYL